MKDELITPPSIEGEPDVERPGRFPMRSVDLRVGAVVSAFIVYALVYLPLRSLIGIPAGLLAIVPISLAGWAYGLYGGFLGGVLVVLLHTLLMNLVYSSGWDVMFRETSGIGPLIGITLGVMLGYWSDLVRAYQQQITRRKQAETALRENEEHLQLFFDQAPVGMAMFDREMRFLAVSRLWKTIYGLNDQNPIGCFYSDVLPEISEMWKAIFRRAMGGEIVQLDQDKYTRKDGSVRCLHWVALPWSGADGSIDGIILFTEDITERNQTDLALLESEQRFEVLSSATFEGIAISERGHIIDVNKQLAEMLGYERTEMIDIPVDQFVAPASLDLVQQHILSASEDPYEHLALRKDGSAFPVEIRAQSLPYNGRIVRVTAIRDISERKRAEVEIERRAEETAALLDTSLALSHLDLDFILKTISQRAKTLFTADGCRIFLLEPDEETLRCVVALQENEAAFSTLRIKIGEGVTGAVAASGRAEIVNNMLHDPRALHVPGTPLEEEAIMFAPLIEHDRTIGVLSIRRIGNERPFQTSDLDLLKAFASMAASAVSNARLLEETQRSLERLATLRQIDQVITGVLDLRVTLDIILGHVISQLKVDAAAVLIYHPMLQSLEYAAGRGFRSERLRSSRFRLGDGFAGRVVLEQRMVQVSDLDQIRNNILLPEFRSEKFSTYVGVPLFVKGVIAGVLEVYHRQPLEPDQEWKMFLDTLAGQVSIAMDNIRLFEDLQSTNLQLRQAYDATIEGWAQALELRDLETEGHSHRTVDLTMELFQRMVLDESQVEHVRRGALLHDIGKMGIPDAILQKKGSLTEEEWMIMRMHPVYAFQWLSPISYLQPALDIPYCHHEHWDGSGYPRGLNGEQIPLAARIFAVVDTWDALCSDRPYRSKWEREKVRAYILEQSGKQFDPKVVAVFMDLVKDR